MTSYLASWCLDTPLIKSMKGCRFLSRPEPRHSKAPLKTASNVFVAEERVPEGLTSCYSYQIGLYAHRCQTGRTSINGPPRELLPTLRPCIGVLTGYCIQANLYAQVQHIVVELEGPIRLGATTGWPTSEDMQQPANQLLRIYLLRVSVHRSTDQSSRGCAHSHPGV
jgi:hypothetical protein